ncbi:hypothetical protein F4805DRAFT_86150 [Annulohypoxylon moriforme]|nr:hypothetical protein F4805DRAFT_86150 [Annulohypoxylon moriforme]
MIYTCNDQHISCSLYLLDNSTISHQPLTPTHMKKQMEAQAPSPETKPCLTCGRHFMPRSLKEHMQSSHLGTMCFFPGHDIQLPREDDNRMTEELMRANEQEGGGQCPGQRQGEIVFKCCWPVCKKGQGQGHSYDRLTSLKRHLRIRQKDELRKYVGEASGRCGSTTAPQVQQQVNKTVQAWNGLHVNMALLEAKFQCLEILVESLDIPGEEISLYRLQRMLADIIKTDELVEEAIRHVESVTTNAKTAPWWEQLAQTRQDWRERLSAWACNVHNGWDHAHVRACLNDILGQVAHIIEQIKAA